MSLHPVKKKRIELYHQDCLEGMRRSLKKEEVDVVVTSPPYNLGITYNKYNDARNSQDYFRWIEEVGLGIKRVLSSEGSFFLNIGSTPQNPWVAFDVAQRLRPHFVLQNQFIWVKSIAIPKNQGDSVSETTESVGMGHYKPVNSERFVHHCFEHVFHWTKTGKVALDRLAIGIPYQDKSNIRRWGSVRSDVRCQGNTWFIPYKTIHSRDKQRPHPATFPRELVENCLRLHGLKKIRKVLDPFLGIGTTALACDRLNKNFIGFEIDKSYLEETKRRLNLDIVIEHGIRRKK